MGDAKKLSSMDASFLYLETPEMPMHVGSMAIFRLPDDYKGDFFEGMKDNEIGLYSKMHHACIDGGAGAALTNMIYDVTPIPRKIEPPTAPAKVGQEPRDIAANLVDSYQQLWTKPFDAATAAKGIDLPRSGKSDLGSILFDNAMFQIESAVKFAGSIPTMLKTVSDVVGKISDPKSRDSI